jgi:nucleotide-binding universal stress UspA family protein
MRVSGADLKGFYRGGKTEVDLEPTRKQRQQLVDEVGKAANAAGIKASTDVLIGNSAAESIIDYAKQNNIDLIVVGTKGMTGVQRFLVGSVANNVISHAHCPVLAVR